MFQHNLTHFTFTAAHPSQTPTLQFSHSKINSLGGFNIRVTCPVSHTIRWISKDLTANCHTAPDLSHLDTGASQRGVFVLSRHGTVGQPGPGFLSEPPACVGRPYLRHLLSLLRKKKNHLDCFLLTCMPSLKPFSESVRICVFYFICVWVTEHTSLK